MRYPYALTSSVQTVAAVALLATSAAPALSLADDTPAASQPAATEPASQPAASQPAPLPLGMMGVEALGLKSTFDDLHLKFYGWIDQSFTFNPDSPSNHLNTLHLYDDRSNDYRFNQFVINLERPLSDGKDFDIGGKFELLYGSDARFTHAAGLTFDGNDTVELDPLQAYIQVRLPVGNGLVVKFGKYLTPIGFESSEAPANALFSHSYLFNFGEPTTHTGIEFDYSFNDKLTAYYGLVEGWDDFKDNNSSMSNMLGLGWTPTDKVSANVNFITGPELTNDNRNYRTLIDLIGSYRWTESTDTNAFSTSINFDFANQSGTDIAGATGDDWYGAAAYATYTFCPQLAATVRGEYFRDETASRIGFTGELIELTAGLDIHPLKNFLNLRFRPEVRWDHALGDKPFDSATKSDQVTIGADLILTF